MQNLKLSVFAALAITATIGTTALAQDYDLVIEGGRVMDPESNFDGIRDVGVSGGKIVKITTDAIESAETIDASGLVVSPGFVDGHLHVSPPLAPSCGC
jgi:N-acyl-D-aspartate/D-glutamate deacylase